LKAGRAPVPRKAPEIFFVVPLHFFALKVPTVSRFGERFRDGQYSLASFLFAVRASLLITVPVRCHVTYCVFRAATWENQCK